MANWFKDEIDHFGITVDASIQKASSEIQKHIDKVGSEISSQRQYTKDDIKDLIDYAAEKLGATVDERVALAKHEVSSLLVEKISLIRTELESAAIRSRRTLWANVGLSVGAAVAMAIVGIVYRKITIEELDVFWLFRVLLLSAATGTGLFAILKTLNQWHSLNREKKNAITVAIGYLGALRPNGAAGLFIVTLVLVVSWFLLNFYVDQ